MESLVDRLHAEHSAMLMTYATNLLGGDRGRAEDVVQETLLRAWLHADRLDHGGPTRSWLLRVTHNLIIDLHRAAKARPVEITEYQLERHPDRDVTDSVLTSVAVNDALRRLGHDHVSVLRHLYLYDHSAPETAQALGIPLGTVKSRAFNGLRKLRQVLAA